MSEENIGRNLHQDIANKQNGHGRGITTGTQVQRLVYIGNFGSSDIVLTSSSDTVLNEVKFEIGK